MSEQNATAAKTLKRLVGDGRCESCIGLTSVNFGSKNVRIVACDCNVNRVIAALGQCDMSPASVEPFARAWSGAVILITRDEFAKWVAA